MNAGLFPPVEVALDRRADGEIVWTNLRPLGPYSGTIPDRLRLWARRTPERVFLTEPSRAKRRAVTYGEAQQIVDRLASRLVRLGLGTDAPLMTLAANGIDHALVLLAAMSVGIPVAVVSPAYAAQSARPWSKLAGIVRHVAPGLILRDEGSALSEALCAVAPGTPVLPVATQGLDILQPAEEALVAAARQGVGPDTIAKLLFTSGSTGAPKAVINTHRMMISNMAGLAAVWPFLETSPPILVDWLPWNHTFGGNCCFNLALYFGGTLHIDDGKPVPALIARTVDALRELKPTLYFSVPSGYEALLPHLEADPVLASSFLGSVKFLFNAAAPMPASIRARLEELAMATLGRIPPIVGGWGSTETAPFSTVIYFSSKHASNLGVPLPGVEIKLVPHEGRTELRVRGPNVTPGYWRQPEATAAAFDDEGFYCIGDAGRFADADVPEQGILFDGRVAENFKLSSGTWVNVGALRLAVIAATRPLVSDAVITGEGRDELGLLLFCNEHGCRTELGETADQERLIARLSEMLALYNLSNPASSLRIGRFAILDEAPSPEHGEITEKGYLNQRAILGRRSNAVEQLYDQGAVVGISSRHPS